MHASLKGGCDQSPESGHAVGTGHCCLHLASGVVDARGEREVGVRK